MNPTDYLLVTFRALDILTTQYVSSGTKLQNSTIAASSAGPGQLLLLDVRIALGIAFLTTFQCFLCPKWDEIVPCKSKEVTGAWTFESFEQSYELFELDLPLKGK
jgi:hypothetical protein